jgi:mono/diheme cytochrome c family protein
LAGANARTTFAPVRATGVRRTSEAARGVRSLLAALSTLSFAGAWACDRPPSADSLAEWTPADHRSSDDDKLAQGAQQAATPRARPRDPSGQPSSPQGGPAPAPAGSAATVAGGGAAEDVAPLVDLTWRQQCANCHGVTGHGDGQLGPMVRAPDLTREDWQSKVTDREIAATIKSGKGKMPNFDVPEPVIDGLVARVRATRGH